MTPQELAELSLQRAQRGFDESIDELIQAVAGDHEMLLAASRIISDQPVDAQGPEHIAFACITAASHSKSGPAMRGPDPKRGSTPRGSVLGKDILTATSGRVLWVSGRGCSHGRDRRALVG